jgi:uncharacterized protein
MPRVLVLMIFGLLAAPLRAQDLIDPQLLTEIMKIRAIDNHTHADGFDPDRPARWKNENPLGNSRYPDVLPLARDNRDWRIAWDELYDYKHGDATLPHLQELLDKKRRASEYFRETWPAAVLDRVRVDIALVNTSRLGPGLDNQRFRWVPYADPLLRPFERGKGWLLYAGGDVTISDLCSQVGVKPEQLTLADYRKRVIDATLARWKSQRAVAVKVLSAYARGLDFDPVPEAVAAAIYLRAAQGGRLGARDRKTLEDYLFNAVAASAGQQGLVVHIHTGNGDGPYFNNHRANPGLLENALNSEALRKTNFVLLHGGWPFHDVAQAMTDKPNTYVDFSAQTFYLGSHQLAQVLRGWLSWHPEKVLFGSDAYSDVDSPLTDWEEKQSLMTYRARWALALALTAMMNNREISREQALDYARMVLHDNAAKLYGLTTTTR